jgi:putative sigma-54 modulation protein
MNVSYTGVAQFTAPQQKKLDSKFAKLAKLLDRNGDKEAHVVLTTQRHLQRAEITVNYYGQSLVGLDSNGDTFQAMTAALDKLEKQILKVRAKWRDTKRTPGAKAWPIPQAAPNAETKPAKNAKPAKAGAKGNARKTAEPPPASRIFRVNSSKNRKPMTLDEAILEIAPNQDHFSYLDADTDRVNVLVRRKDGHFDLIES